MNTSLTADSRSILVELIASAVADQDADSARSTFAAVRESLRRFAELGEDVAELVAELDRAERRLACAVDGCVAAAAGRWDIAARPTSFAAVPLCRAHVAEHRADPSVSAVRPHVDAELHEFEAGERRHTMHSDPSCAVCGGVERSAAHL